MMIVMPDIILRTIFYNALICQMFKIFMSKARPKQFLGFFNILIRINTAYKMTSIIITLFTLTFYRSDLSIIITMVRTAQMIIYNKTESKILLNVKHF